jgi:molybdopterin synthase catalytic subunit
MNDHTQDDPGRRAEVVLADVREDALSLDEVVAAVRHPRAGGIATFIGVVREQDHGVAVDALDYSAHPSAPGVLREVAQEVADRSRVIALAAVHRVGHLEIGDVAVVVAVSAAHRGAALTACHELIDELKARVPIWKHQMFSDGSDEWVGLP